MISGLIRCRSPRCWLKFVYLGYEFVLLSTLEPDGTSVGFTTNVEGLVM